MDKQEENPKEENERESGKKNALNIELPADVAEGVYSNMAMVCHSSSEFVLDFVRMVPGLPKAVVKSRVVMNAESAKKLLALLAGNVEAFERQFGPISLPDERKSRFLAGYPGVKGEA